MNFWLKKKRYNSGIKNIILNNSLFFFWDFDKKSSQKEFLLFLEKLNIFTFWLKTGVFNNYHTNKKLSEILKSQCNFSYSKLNDINLNLFIKLLEDNKENLIILGFLLNKNLFIDPQRLSKVKTNFSFIQEPTNYYKDLLRNFILFYTINRSIIVKKIFFLSYKKNFTLIK